MTIKAGTNIAFLNGLMNVIINESLLDGEYVQNRTEGFEELWELVKEYIRTTTSPTSVIFSQYASSDPFDFKPNAYLRIPSNPIILTIPKKKKGGKRKTPYREM